MNKRMGSVVAAILALFSVLFSTTVAACALGKMYNLPIPFNMYATGAAVALVASFIVVAYVFKSQAASVNVSAGSYSRASQMPSANIPRWLISALGSVSVFSLFLAVAAGLFGTMNPLNNFGMVFIWITSTLGLTYLTPLIGDVYALISPWRTLCDRLEKVNPGIFSGKVRFAERLKYYPALILYMIFIWIELFGMIPPQTLSVILVSYTALNLAAAWLVGREAWFQYGEFFSVFFRLLGKMSPLEYVRTRDSKDAWRVQVRKPFLGLLEAHAEHGSLLLFVIFMISSTAFDGAHDTLPWVGLFWRGIYPALATVISRPYPFWLDVYLVWQAASLFLLPILYLAIYLLLLWAAKQITKTSVSLHALALRFAFTLVPIAFVYNLAHYYTEFVSEGIQVVRMISDPFSRGWNIFGTSGWFQKPIILDAGQVWHTQVGLILFGHIVSVYLAHVEALKSFPSRRNAILSQVPMLLLMVLLTTVGLWILSLPIDAGQVPAMGVDPR
jgi:hypothetical protein